MTAGNNCRKWCSLSNQSLSSKLGILLAVGYKRYKVGAGNEIGSGISFGKGREWIE